MSDVLVYDFVRPPDPERWLALDEKDQVELVRVAHERARATVGKDATAHAMIHTVVETRLARGHHPVVTNYERLRAAGLDRHTVIHALGSVVVAQLQTSAVTDTSWEPSDDRAFFDLDPDTWRAEPPYHAAPNRKAAHRPRGKRKLRSKREP